MGSATWHGKRYRQVDVFANSPLGGNGLCVFWESGGLATEDMQALTIELRQFETIFLETTGTRGEFNARVFTMEEELDFAGHPLLGGAAVLHEKFGTGALETWAVQLRTSTARIRTEKQGGSFQATMYRPPAFFNTSSVADSVTTDLVRSLNLDPLDLHPDLPLEVVSTGLPYLIVPLRTGLGKAKILIENLEQLLQMHGAKFIYLYDVEHSEGRTWDNKGKVEDIATGSAAGPVAAYMCKHGRLPVGKELLIRQGRYVGRPSILRTRVLGSAEALGEIEVSGSVQLVSEGVLD